MTDSLETSEAEALSPDHFPDVTKKVDPDNAAVLDAIALLIESADELEQGVSIGGVADWEKEQETKLYRDRHLRAAEAVSTLRHQAAELQRDAARIDWLSDPAQAIGNVQLPRDCVERNVHSLRAAIDAAMARAAAEIGRSMK